MIIIALILTILILIIANTIVSTNKKRQFEKQKVRWKNAEVEIITKSQKPAQETSIIKTEKQFINFGRTIANEQKINLLNKRLENVEKAITGIAKNNLLNEEPFDYEKVDFRLKVIEKQLDEIKNPVEKKNTFFGRENDAMEERIKALAFNCKK
jgi:hypothetical protein